MPETRFLCAVADYYTRPGSNCAGLTMVLPNKRAAMFMKKYLKDRIRGVGFMPKVVDISYFTHMHSQGTALAAPVEQLFVLYDCYRRVMTRRGRIDDMLTFDSFVFWGQIILNDFNDVDAYMADASKLYANLRGLREIRSNYLTEPQREVAERLQGSFIYQDCERFWAHFAPEGGEDKVKEKFLNIWGTFEELYNEFHAALARRDIPQATSGRQSRLACEKIRSMGAEDFRGQRFAFIGFNILSTSRVLMLKRLRDLGVAEFFWDTASPFLAQAEGMEDIHNKASKFILSLALQFPAPDDFELPALEWQPEVEIISVPSNEAQVKVAASILQQWTHAEEGQQPAIKPGQWERTAVVVPDQSLLMPMLHSLPPQIENVNVTLGLSYGSTALASLLSGVFAMHLRTGRRPGSFFNNDILSLLSHPYVMAIAPNQAVGMRRMLLENKLYNVPASELREKFPKLAFLFEELDDDSVQAAIRLCRRLASALGSAIKPKSGTKEGTFESSLVKAFGAAVEELCGYMAQYNVAMEGRTLFFSLERTLMRLQGEFSGKPLEGLQVMGLKDTRCLDFENIVILSMNDSVVPRRSTRPTFIPEALRSGYGLPTLEHDESATSYQVFRLLGRARRARLLYDSRQGLTGGMSRYLYQLIFLPSPARVAVRLAELDSRPDDERKLEVAKEGEALIKLRRFLSDTPEADKLYLSASALKTYIKCPLSFYLKYVRGMRDEVKVREYIDAASFGSALHRVAQWLYPEDTIIDAETIDILLRKDIEMLGKQALNEISYNKRYTHPYTNMPGEGQALSKILAKYIRTMLEAERKLPPFTFKKAEVGERDKHTWQIGGLSLNFKMSIDRIDVIDSDGSLRFIDYKTGKDALSANDIESLLTNPDKGAMMQLFTYCHAYHDIQHADVRIQPKIYRMLEFATKGLPDMSIGRKPVVDYRDYPEFREGLEALIQEIFHPEVPFRPTDNWEECKYCPFIDMCSRRKKDYGNK